MDRVKTHLEEYKQLYISIGISLSIAGITYLIVRNTSQCIKGANYGVLTQGANYGVLGDNNIVNYVSYISSERKGPPSWIIKCLDTGEIFESQKEAAKALGISSSKLSEHLTGKRNNAQGYHFVRLGLSL